MGIKFSLGVVLALVLVAVLGVEGAGLTYLFGVVIPYLAIFTFLAGFVYRILKWARCPVPFRIPTTSGQQQSLPWVKQNKFDNPSTTFGVVVRMALEVLLFRSLFKNTKLEFRDGPRIAYQWEKWLWLGALLFHYSLLMIILRHVRFFTEPVPFFVYKLENLDGFFQVGLPGLYVSDVIFIAAVTFLFIRRLVIPNMRYISLPADYFPLLIFLGLGVSGVFMRYFTRIDVVKVKELAMGLVTFHPTVPEGIGVLFFIHLMFFCTLIAYFPFSKLMHMGGIFLSPTRNLPNDSRIRRHINPWNAPVPVHTYAEYEDDFREKMIEAGLPVEKE